MHDHRFHELTVRRVVRETDEARSFVLDVPRELRAAFIYDAGQFCTFRVRIDGEPQLRCYSMSSSPAVDPELQVTVKRVPGGAVSNWMNDVLEPGAVLEVTCPSGVFRLGPREGDIIAFAAGSGITPVISIVKEALATTTRRVRLLYANRDTDAVIFAAELLDLAGRHADRLEVVHHFDVERGFVDAAAVVPFVGGSDADYYLCGPAPFMDTVEAALLDRGVDVERIHVERFTPAAPPAPVPSPADPTGPTMVTIALDGRTAATEHRPGTTILQAARQLGLAPPFSCESGNCATCMAKLVRGTVKMYVNNALTDDEVADRWILTCQSVPTSAEVSVEYES
jgi:ferredoxin-NADP reductase